MLLWINIVPGRHQSELFHLSFPLSVTSLVSSHYAHAPLGASEQTRKWENPESSTCARVGAVRCEGCRFNSSSSHLSGDGCHSFKADCFFLHKHLLHRSVCTPPHTDIHIHNKQSSQPRGELECNYHTAESPS